jgi:hypothetical protein
VVLIGSLSISEDSRLGTYEWHLTFPIARPSQWPLKATVAIATGALLGIALPVLLAVLTSFKVDHGLLHLIDDRMDALSVLLLLLLLVLVSFWAASFLRDVARATLGTMLVMVAGVACAASDNGLLSNWRGCKQRLRHGSSHRCNSCFLSTGFLISAPGCGA